MRELAPWLHLLAQRRGRLLLGALLIALTIAGGIGLLALSGWFITATGITALLWAGGVRTPFDVYIPGGGIRFFALLRTLSRYAERVYNHDTVLRLLADLRTSQFRAISRLDAATLSRWRSAQWLNRLTADIDTLDTLYLRLLAPPAVALLGIGVVTGLIAWFLPELALVTGAGLLGLWLALTVVMAGWTTHLSSRQVDHIDGLRSQAVEQIQGLAELTAAGALAGHQARLLRASGGALGEEQALRGRTAIIQALGTLGVQGLALLVLFVGLLAYREGAISGPVAVMLTLALMGLAEALNSLPAAFAQYGATRRAASRLNEQGRLGSRLAEPSAGSEPPRQPDLCFEQIGVNYAAIGLLNLTLPAGQRLAVIGPSGCGKSTLADLAARLIDPNQGKISSGGIDLKQMPLASWRERVGYLTQRTELMHDTIAANLRLARPEAGYDELWAALEWVDLADTVESFADGILTWVGESGRQLSGGQARRLALARVLLKDAPLLVLDEPFSGLDAATAARIRTNIDPLLQGRTVLMLAHEPDALPRADRQLSWSQLSCG